MLTSFVKNESASTPNERNNELKLEYAYPVLHTVICLNMHLLKQILIVIYLAALIYIEDSGSRSL
jgi:hypothetical protein